LNDTTSPAAYAFPAVHGVAELHCAVLSAASCKLSVDDAQAGAISAAIRAIQRT
jgi:hypothetical protein